MKLKEELSLRQYVAIQIMAAIISKPMIIATVDSHDEQKLRKKFAEDAVKCADALIEEFSK